MLWKSGAFNLENIFFTKWTIILCPRKWKRPDTVIQFFVEFLHCCIPIRFFFSKETFYGLRMEMMDINLLLFTTILNLRFHLGTRYFQSIKTILDVVLLVFSLRRRALPNTVNFLKVHFKNQSCVRFNYHRTIVCQLYTLFLIRQSCNV